jgi:UDP-N-acetylmuramoyl-L-alanyl-D-glutamate--2,6-diaminopimelate ligase
MLNKSRLEKILNSTLPDVLIRDIHWRSQDSRSDGLLFYKINTDSKSEGLFHERIKQTHFGLLVVNRLVSNLPANTIVIDEAQWPEVQNQLMNELYPLPNIKFLGITGTNGKTTTTDLVLQLGEMVGKKGLSIGTLGVRENHKTILDFGMTSPSFIDLRKFLHNYGSDKDFCVMEASSHALVQDRLHGIQFDAAGWLSFSQDHLDYHQNMDEYFSAKCLIYNYMKSDAKLFVPTEQKDLFQKLHTFSGKTESAPEIFAELPLFFRTRFNKNNLEVAWALVSSVFKKQNVVDFNQLTSPDGRFYIQSYRTNFIIVDFAHTPDALENICQGIRETFPQYKLKVLFGCGGDRDRTKRPKMGAVVDKWADQIYVTSDNPRSENPEQIISDILVGIKSPTVKAITERPKAVKIAFSELKDKEVLLLAGKGHEDYILINGVKNPYSDIREVDEFIARNKLV